MNFSPVKRPSISFHPKRSTGEKTAIFTKVYWSGKMFKIYTNVKVNVKEYQKLNKSKNKDWYTNTDIEEDLLFYRRKVDSAFDSYINQCKVDNVPFVFNQFKELCKSFFDSSMVNPLDKRKDLIAFAKDFERTAQRAKDTKKTYRTVISQLENFRKQTRLSTSFTQIDFDFYDAFVDYLYSLPTKTGEPVKVNTVGKKISILKVFLKQSFERGYHQNTIFNHSDFKTERETIDAIALTDEELSKIKKVDFTGRPAYLKTQDLFLFNSLVGLRYSDLYKLKKQHFDLNGDFPKIVFHKTQKSSSDVHIGLVDDALEILKRYDYKLPKVKLQNFNRYIKEIGKLAGLNDEVMVTRTTQANQKIEENRPLYNWLTSHVMRKTFATNALEAGVSLEYISKTLGHASIKTTERYLGIKKKVVAKEVYQILNKK